MAGARPARWPMFVILAVLAAGGGWALVAELGSDTDSGTAPATNVPTEHVDGPPAALSRSVEAYQVAYRVEGFAADGTVLVDTERRWVRLPFDSRVEVSAGDGPGGEVTFLQIAGFGVLQTGRPGQAETAVLTVEPGPAPGDARVTELDRGLLEWRHQRRTVAGRTCEVHRASGPVDIDRLEPVDPAADTYADLCVDAAGIVLHEEWYVDGRLFRRRTAQMVDEGTFPAGRLFAPTGTPIPPRDGGGGLAELTPGSRPEDVAFYELPQPPPGFSRRGRYAYTPPRSEDERSAVVDVPRVAAVLDVWVRGPDVLVVENGGTIDNDDPFAPPPEDDAVDAGEVGVGQVLEGIRSAEVRVLLDRGRYVRVRGTLPADALLELARSLGAAEGDAPGVVPVTPPPSTTVPPREPGAAPAVTCTRDDQDRLTCRQRD